METTALRNRLLRLSAVNLTALAANLGIARRDPAPFGQRGIQKAQLADLLVSKAELRFTRALPKTGQIPFFLTDSKKTARVSVPVLRAPSARFCFGIGVSK